MAGHGGARGIQSIEVGGRILSALARSGEPMMLKDLAQAANLAPAQCHAYLTSLRKVGLVHQDPGAGNYRMGPFAMRLGIGWLRMSPLISAAALALRSLTDELGVLSLVVIWGAGGPTIVHINEGTARMALNLRQGTFYSVTGTASGRIFAAFGDDPDVRTRIEEELRGANGRRTLGQRLSRETFESEMAATLRLRYATARGAPIPGVNAVSAPVFGADGRLGLVASLVGPEATLPVDEGSVAVRRLLDAAAAIQAGFGPEGGANG